MVGQHQQDFKPSWQEVNRRYCDQGWRFAHNGVAFHGATSVAIVRYRYRGTRIPNPWTITAIPADDQ